MSDVDMQQTDTGWEDGPADGPGPLFDGDTGQMSLEVRRTFVALLKKRYISSEQHATEWRVLLQNQTLLESRFNDMFLHLIVDRDYEVAFKKQAVGEAGGSFPTVLHDTAYTREQTVLMVYLREVLRSKRAAGDEAVFVDQQDLVDEVATFRSASATNQVRDEKAARNAVDSLATAGILLKTNEDDRYRVSPIIEVLLPVHRVQELIAWLMNEQGARAAINGQGAESEADPA